MWPIQSSFGWLFLSVVVHNVNWMLINSSSGFCYSVTIKVNREAHQENKCLVAFSHTFFALPLRKKCDDGQE